MFVLYFASFDKEHSFDRIEMLLKVRPEMSNSGIYYSSHYSSSLQVHHISRIYKHV